MKKITDLCLPILLVFTPFAAVADDGLLEVLIDYVGSVSSTYPDPLAQSIYTARFEHTTQVGSCPLSEGKLYFEVNPQDKGIVSILLAAKSAGKTVRVSWNDSAKNQRGYCLITAVQLP